MPDPTPAPIAAPKSIDEFVAWCRDKQGVDWGSDAINRWFRANAQICVTAVRAHASIVALPDFLGEQNAAFIAQKKVPLLDDLEVSFIAKSFESTVEKIFRSSVVNNNNFPEPPVRGWITPENLFTVLDDIVRGQVVCGFLDGAAELASAVCAHVEAHDCTASFIPQGRARGYYAYHVRIDIPCEVVGTDWVPKQIVLPVELQVRTRLQSVLYDLTHLIYEIDRVSPPPDPEQVKWDLKSPRYKAAYLGHTLHLIESVLVELRDGIIAGLPPGQN